VTLRTDWRRNEITTGYQIKKKKPIDLDSMYVGNNVTYDRVTSGKFWNSYSKRN